MVIGGNIKQHSMNQNSIDTYLRIVLPNLKKKHTRVMTAIAELGGEATVYEIADHLNTEVHKLSGRLTELSTFGDYERPQIVQNGKRNNKYGNPCTIWKIYEPANEGKQVMMF
jgi:predicted transcriptional regulator